MQASGRWVCAAALATIGGDAHAPFHRRREAMRWRRRGRDDPLSVFLSDLSRVVQCSSVRGVQSESFPFGYPPPPAKTQSPSPPPPPPFRRETTALKRPGPSVRRRTRAPRARVSSPSG